MTSESPAPGTDPRAAATPGSPRAAPGTAVAAPVPENGHRPHPHRRTDTPPRLLPLGRWTPTGARLEPGMLLGWALATTALALGILLCALALAALVGVASLAGGPWQGAGDRLGAAVARTGQWAATSGQAALDLFDPRHPPREPLRLDTEFDALSLVAVGEPLGVGAESRLALAGIAKRADARDEATAQYAVVRRELISPRRREVLGVPLGEERGQQEHYLYAGQSFRLGTRYYKVNWVSVDRQQMAIGRYRSADGALGPLAFEYD